MRHVSVLFVLAMILPAFTPVLQAQESESQYIEWTGENESANTLVSHGIWFMMNFENEKAVAMFQSALHEDPDLFAPHVVLSFMGTGDAAEAHAAKAKELVEGKNEVSQLFVTMLDIEDGDNEAGSKVWADMAELAPDGNFVQFFYALTREDQAETKTILEGLIAKMEEGSGNSAPMHNILGYFAMESGDMETAKKHFDTYVSMYSGGYNPHDSMGDYYKAAGDNEQAMASYAMAIENYSGASGSIAKMKALKEEMANADKGVLVVVSTEHVIPEHMDDYWQWGVEYKAKAEEDGYSTFYVDGSANNSFSYASIAGYDLEDVQEHQEAWMEWGNSEEMQEMYNKYKHSVEYTERAIWRHSPALSYYPESYDGSANPEYVRVFKGYIKFGHEEEVEAIMKAFKDESEEHGMSNPYQVYWNVYGEDGPCIGVRTLYGDEDEYAERRNEMVEKVGQERMMELRNQMAEHMRSFQETESWPIEGLTHIQNSDS